MGQALVFGLIGSSALVIGGAIGAYWRTPHQISGVLLALPSGTLISALAFELFPEAVHLGGLWPAGLGLIAGGLTFVVINTALDSWVARSAGDPHEVPALSAEAAEDISGAEAQQTERVQETATQQAGSAAVGFALLAAVTLDGVPENLALGVSLLSGGGKHRAAGGDLLLELPRIAGGCRRDAPRGALGALRDRDLVAHCGVAHRRSGLR